MKYPEHISEFWRVRSIDSSLTNDDFALYSYLCNLLNHNFWETDTITQRGGLICGQLQIGPKTLQDSRNRLKQKGFIDFFSKTIIDRNGQTRGVKGSSVTYVVLNRHLNRLPNRNRNGDETESNRSRNDQHEINRNRKGNDDVVATEFRYAVGDVGFDSMADYLTQEYSILMENLKGLYGDLIFSKALIDFSNRNLQKKWKNGEDFRKHLNDAFKKFNELNGDSLKKQSLNGHYRTVNDIFK